MHIRPQATTLPSIIPAPQRNNSLLSGYDSTIEDKMIGYFLMQILSNTTQDTASNLHQPISQHQVFLTYDVIFDGINYIVLLLLKSC